MNVVKELSAVASRREFHPHRALVSVISYRHLENAAIDSTSSLPQASRH